MRITVGSTEATRRPADQVLGVPGGPSKRGSTYWTRVLACPREHYLANVVRWRPLGADDALDTGLLWHAMLEVYYRARCAAQATWRAPGALWAGGLIRDQEYFRLGEQEGVQAAFRVLEKVGAEPGYEEIHGTLERMFDSYLTFAQWDRWELVGVEADLFVPLEAGHGFEYSARMDAIVVDHSQHEPVLRGIEHKSSYRLDGNVTTGYLQDLQTLGQAWLLANADFSLWGPLPPRWGTLVSITSKTKVPKHERVQVMPGPVVLDNWARSMRAWQKLRLDVWPAMDYPQNFASCGRRFGRCQFFSLCQAHPDWTPEHVGTMVKPPAGYGRWE